MPSLPLVSAVAHVADRALSPEGAARNAARAAWQLHQHNRAWQELDGPGAGPGAPAVAGRAQAGRDRGARLPSRH